MAGVYPGGRSESNLGARLHGLLQAGVTFFLDLTERGEKGMLPYYAALRRETRSTGRVVQYARLPIPDFGTPTTAQMQHILNLLDGALSEGYTVYLHCYAGIGRTGMVVGCFLVRHGWSGQKALDKIAALRRGLDSKGYSSPITRDQRRLVREWAMYDGLRSSGCAVGSRS